MRRWRIAAATLLLAAACAREPARPAGPSAHFPDRIHDFGQVLQGTRVEHAFPIENRGGAELRLERSQATFH